MYFSSRHALGQTLAARVANLASQEPIIVCLKESALSVAISTASKLHGWVYPLLTEPVMIPGDDRFIGVINQDGALCYNPELSKFERDDMETENESVIQEASREAFSALNHRMQDYGTLNKEALRGRTIVLISDIIKDQLQVGAAHELLKTVATGPIISLVGNITPDSSTALYLESTNSMFLDIVPNMFDDNHYFEQPDSYTIQEQRKLAMNISQYWD